MYNLTNETYTKHISINSSEQITCWARSGKIDQECSTPLEGHHDDMMTWCRVFEETEQRKTTWMLYSPESKTY